MTPAEAKILRNVLKTLEQSRQNITDYWLHQDQKDPVTVVYDTAMDLDHAIKLAKIILSPEK